MTTQLERLIFMDTLIRDGCYPSTKVLTEHFKVHQRTAYRDIRLLRDLLKAPLAYNSLRRGYYYVQPDWSLLNLSDSQTKLLRSLLGIELLRRKLVESGEHS